VSFLLLNERLLFFLLNPCCKGNRHVFFNGWTRDDIDTTFYVKPKKSG
jgi:hypothetical protein